MTIGTISSLVKNLSREMLDRDYWGMIVDESEKKRRGKFWQTLQDRLFDEQQRRHDYFAKRKIEQKMNQATQSRRR